ncbi:kinase-like protein, partial [Viridothelium virens]
ERPGLIPRRLSRKVVPGLPRPQTFTRQNSEKRERLYPIEPCAEERRAVSVDRRTNLTTKRTRSPPPISIASVSAPDVASTEADASTLSFVKDQKETQGHNDVDSKKDEPPSDPPPAQLPPVSTTSPFSDRDDLSDGLDDRIMQEELDCRWILNLSMHFRDKSDREKFFVTYAAEPNRWLRVTISCDYRDALPDSLEGDLKSLHFQRDKSDRIYEAIRDSLPGIQFYESVTNLKLQTEDNRLHVHVTEDVNEIIDYPPTTAIQHLDCPRYPENMVHFAAHLSGFVYKVEINGRYFIKKEIPGPDTVDEFLYEVNALNSLSESPNVIRLEGMVVSNDGSLVKGLLISVAERGALVDLLYDEKGCIPWPRRERWASQVVQGLSEIHEAGFVQGDFTLSNIVIDKHDDAHIIDINRRGCPVGWEPPELAILIERGQRIGMHIGVKTDIFQLGMVLWGLARGEDEPERQERPLGFDTGAHEGTPEYFQEIVTACLSERPQGRLSAKELLRKFPHISDDAALLDAVEGSTSTAHRSDKEYIDPDTAIKLEDIEAYRRKQMNSGPSGYSTEDVTDADADPSTDYRFDSSGSYIVGRGRSNVSSARRRNDSPYARPVSSIS